MNLLKSLEEIGNKLGICACLLVFWMYLQIGQLEERVEQLDRTTADLAEVKENVASINAKLEILLSDFSLKREVK